VLQKLVVCTGAATCKLGICLSRGVAGGIENRLQKSTLNLDAVGDLSIHVSGCPNSCGRHPIASIGLHGAARRVDERLVPHYILQTGGHVKEGETVLATGHHSIPARNVPALIEDLLRALIQSSTPSDFRAFLRDGGDKIIDTLAARYKQVPNFDEDKNFYYDWGASELFSLAGRGPGECGAGVFDLIEVDLKSAGEALAEENFFKAAALAARALLVTRGEQAQNDRDAFLLFQKHFVDAGLADAQFTQVLKSGANAAGNSPTGSGFEIAPTDVAGFVASVQMLFKQMDASLQFPKKLEATTVCAAAKPLAAIVSEPPSAVIFDLEKDFRGVVCPLNYVKTKMALGTLKNGQILSVLLDEAGARNVPESAAKDGHEILSNTSEGDTFRLIIRKG